jgi:hypothetical protein
MTIRLAILGSLAVLALLLACILPFGVIAKHMRGMYFLRFQLLAAVALVTFPVLATSEGAKPLLGALLVLEKRLDVFLVIYLTFLNCWMLMATCLMMWL